MKTIMIINGDKEFSKRIQETIKDEKVTILTAHSNRSALQLEDKDQKIDLFLISNPNSKEIKEFYTCKSTASFSSPIQDTGQIVYEDSPIEELKTIIKNNL